MFPRYDLKTSKRLLYTLFAAQSLSSAAQIAVFTLITITAAELGGGEGVAGVPSSTLTFAQALSAFPIAMVMGRYGRRIGLALGYTGGIAGAVIGIVAILGRSFPLLLVAAAFLGTARAGSDQGRFAAGEMFPESERARMIGRLIFAGTIGAVIGPLLVAPSGRLMEALGFSADIGTWVLMGVFSGLALLTTFIFLRPDPMIIARALEQEDQTARSVEDETEARPLSALLALPRVQLAVLAVIVSQTVMVVLMVMTPLHMHHLQHPTEAISLVLAAHSLGMFGLSPFTGYFIDRFGRIPMLLAGAVILIASCLLAPLSGSEFILAAALFLLGLGWNFGYVAGSSLLVAGLQERERTRVQGANDTLVFLAAGIGSIVAGGLFAASGYIAIAIAGLTLSVTLIGLVLWYNRPQMRVEMAA